ncbi:amino acid adenylation domain-containing protein [Actinomadura viridis]|uniref:amino acid adenylation domain-containing protein n=1 Tax=Actinomadura viridis TaxID=58110 RepID=UPI0036A7E36A
MTLGRPGGTTPVEALTLLSDFVVDSVRKYPDRTALEVAGVRLTYRELWDCAHAAAIRLRAGGAPRRVAVLAHRSPAAYVGYLAALLTGAAVVPLNPDYPLSRNLAISRAAGTDAVVTDDAGSSQLVAIAAQTAVRCLDLSGQAWRPDNATPTAWRDEDVTAGADPDALAYIMFTSGSTGAPKGVPITHRNICAFISHHIARYEVGPGSRWAQNGELTFDASVTAMFVAWGTGGTLVVPRHRELLAPVRFLNDNAITHCVLVPSVVSFAQRLRALPAGSLPDLRCTVFGAEQLTLSQARAWRAAAPRSRIENAYGPTELTVCCSAYWLPEDEAQWPRTSNGSVPIGAVYPYLESLVLGDDGRAADDGELCVRGVQRFSGYLDPADNVGRFLSSDGERTSVYDGSGPLTERHWYRTGDRVRREQSRLVCLGRLDHQVKVSGHRIELGEIEAVLGRHPAIVDVLVLPVTATDNEVDLVAVYTGTEVAARDLAALVRDALPSHMVPRTFRWLSRFPYTQNGKVDRRALTDLLTTEAQVTGEDRP